MTARDDGQGTGTTLRPAGPTVGEFRADVRTDRWEWSPEVYAIHGFEPHEVVPTTALVLAHVHPDDRGTVESVLRASEEGGGTFGSVHRIMDARGAERVVTLLGQAQTGADGAVTALAGQAVDVTLGVDRVAQERATRSILASAERRQHIEQAKGVVAFAYGIEPEDAFGLLRTASQRRNVPLRELAADLVSTVPRLAGDPAEVVAQVGLQLGEDAPRAAGA